MHLVLWQQSSLYCGYVHFLLCWLVPFYVLLLAAKLQIGSVSLSAMPINGRCGFRFRKVSPLSGYPSSPKLFRVSALLLAQGLNTT